jgi:hypothetical protein
VAGTSADAARRIGIRLSALAQDGLTYAADDYDRDRYRQLSLGRVNHRQLERALAHHRDPSLPSEFD